MTRWQREIAKHHLRAAMRARRQNGAKVPSEGKTLKKLTLLHSNDLHGDFLADEVDSALVGGVSMLSG